MVDFHRLLFKTYTFLVTVKVSVIERDVFNYVLNNGEMCYDEIGCFRNDERNPCANLTVLPYGTEDMGAKFYLYTPENASGKDAQIIDYFNPINMTLLKVNTTRALFVVVHGFSQVYWYTNGKFLRPMKEALIEAGNNVMLIDWVAGADFPNYYQAASNLRVVGAMIGNVISRMEKYKKAYINTTTILGWSLGCQTAGFAGKRLVQLGTPVRSIVGLDPARSLFAGAPAACRLDSSDAIFVQVVHTNGGESDVVSNSSPLPTGHVDFYANGGRVQDACLLATSQSKCSHDLSFIYYIESMRAARKDNACKFVSFPCKDEKEWENGNCAQCSPNGCQTMGYEADTTARGKFYFNTLSENKTLGGYCGVQYLASMSSSDVNVRGEITFIVRHPDNKSEQTIIFQSEEEIFEPDVIKSRVIVLWHPLTSGSHVSLLYRKNDTDVEGTEGPEAWTVDKLQLSRLSTEMGAIFALHRRLIRDGELVVLDLEEI